MKVNSPWGNCQTRGGSQLRAKTARNPHATGLPQRGFGRHYAAHKRRRLLLFPTFRFADQMATILSCTKQKTKPLYATPSQVKRRKLWSNPDTHLRPPPLGRRGRAPQGEGRRRGHCPCAQATPRGAQSPPPLEGRDFPRSARFRWQRGERVDRLANRRNRGPFTSHRGVAKSVLIFLIFYRFQFSLRRVVVVFPARMLRHDVRTVSTQRSAGWVCVMHEQGPRRGFGTALGTTQGTTG